MIQITKQNFIKYLLKIFAAMILLTLLAVVLLFANGLVGNPISKMIARNKIQTYIQAVYSVDSKVDKIYYNLVTSSYEAKLQINGRNLLIRFSSNTVRDDNVSEFFQEEFNQDYPAALTSFNKDHIKFPAAVEIATGMVQDRKYDKGFEKKQKLYLLGVQNSDKTISQSESQQLPARIAVQLLEHLGDKYNFVSIQMRYTDKYGVYEILLENTTLVFDELWNHTRKLDDDNLGVEEREFIEQLNS